MWRLTCCEEGSAFLLLSEAGLHFGRLKAALHPSFNFEIPYPDSHLLCIITLIAYYSLPQTVTIRVGKPIFFQDLITKHEALHGSSSFNLVMVLPQLLYFCAFVVGDSILIPTFWATVGKLRKVHPHRTDGSEQASTAEGKDGFFLLMFYDLFLILISLC